MQAFERSFTSIVLGTIFAVTVANLVVNYTGTVKLAQVLTGFPINLANALRAGTNR